MKRGASSVSAGAIGLLSLAAVFLTIPAFSPQPQDDADRSSINGTTSPRLANLGMSPLSFEPLEGQLGMKGDFLARGPGYALLLDGGGSKFALQSNGPTHTVLTSRLIGASSNSSAIGIRPLPGTVNYFLGSDPRNWRGNIPTYAAISYPEIYPGIDLVYYGNPGHLEYDFVVAPGADPARIVVEFGGQSELVLTGAGDAVLMTEDGEVRLRAPLVYQERDGARFRITGTYAVVGENRLGFAIAEYDRTRPLVIDPVMTYSSYIGGTRDDGFTAVGTDSTGNIYAAGTTTSPDFPVVGALQPACGPLPAAPGNCSVDGIILKLSPDGSTVLYATYFGGSGLDVIHAMRVDSTGVTTFAGETNSTDFPATAGVAQPACALSPDTFCRDAFVAKLSADGSALTYSTYFGGSGTERIAAVAIDGAGNAYVTGTTDSTDLPTTLGAFQEVAPAATCAVGVCTNAFAVQVAADGSALVYATYLGGGDNDRGLGVAVDGTGNAYLSGGTVSTDFPATVGAFQEVPGGAEDAFVAKLDAAGAALTYATYLGGTDGDAAESIAVDGTGNAYVTGTTLSTDLPVTVGSFQELAGGGLDGFVAKLDSTGATLTYASYLGGSGDENANVGASLALDSSGNAHITGDTLSTDFPTVGALQVAMSIPTDAYIAVVDATGASLTLSTFLGGNDFDMGEAITVDGAGNIVVAGQTASLNFPTVAPVADSAPRNLDGFIVKIEPISGPGLALGPGNLIFEDRAVDSTSLPRTVTMTNVGDVALTLSSVAISGDFDMINGCVSSLAPGATCTLTITFSPTIDGPIAGAITITDDAAGNPHLVPLNGSAFIPLPDVTLEPDSLEFGKISVGATGNVQSINLINSGDADLTVATVVLGGANPGDFSIFADPCTAAVVAPNDICTVEFDFTPTVSGMRTADVTITNDAASSPQLITLTGEGAEVQVTPSPLDFGAFRVGLESDPQTLTITNISAADVSLSGGFIAVGSGATYVVDEETDTCTDAILTPAGTCTIDITFTPLLPGERAATINVNNAAGDRLVSSRLTGVGLDFLLTTSVFSTTIKAGQAVNATITTRPLGDNPYGGTITYSCENLPDNATCEFAPATLTPDVDPVDTTLTINTTRRKLSARGTPLDQLPPGQLLLLGFALLSALLWIRGGQFFSLRRRSFWIPVTAILCLVLIASSCGGTKKGTPSGTFRVSITGVDGELTRSTLITLTVE